ncbi:MAG: replicative DNA helicase [Rubrobacter sp.]|nr:replicative DNA helicase [Rubrobacter sp.]
MERRGNIRGVPAGGDAARVPPHDPDAERAVIGAMLVSETAVASVAEQLAAEDFYSETHRVIYGSMMRLYARGERIDQITLTSDLNNVGEFEKVGGRRYIFDIVESVPTASNASRYAEIVRGKALLRSVIDAGSRITEDAFREPDNVGDALDSAEQLIYNISNRSLKDHLAPVSELAPGALEMIQNLYEADGEVTGVETGFEDLDRLTTGFHKSDLVVLAARPAMGKCLAADSEIVLDDGSISTIEEIFNERRGRMMTLGGDLRFSWTSPSAFVDDGMKPVFRVRTRLGRKIETTITHPFLTFDGWRKLGEIPVGERIAAPRRMPVFGNEAMGGHRIRLLAYMIGDGCMLGATPRFTNGSAVIREDFREAVKKFGGLGVRECDSNGTRTPTLRVVSDGNLTSERRRNFARTLDEAIGGLPYSAARLADKLGVSPGSISHWRRGVTVPDDEVFSRLSEALAENGVEVEFGNLHSARKNQRNSFAEWLDGLGVWGVGAKGKFVPRAIFQAPKEEVSLFLNRLFATDGWATVLASGQAQIGFCSVSERLARQIQHLLLRFGVVAALKERSVKYGDGRRVAYQIDITGRDSILAFVEEIGVFGKEDAVEAVVAALAERKPHSNRDLVPAGAWDAVGESLGDESWASLARRMGHGAGHNFHVGRRMISRDRMSAFADALDDRKLREMAESDVYWDQIVSIEPLGLKQVYDLTIPETHNFVANDVCVHNTAFALNAIWHAAGEKKAPVAIFSLEMSKEQLVQRLISQTTRIPTQALRSGNVKAEDWPKLLRGVAQVSEAPIWIDDTAGVSLMEMRAKTRRLSSQLKARGETPLSLVVVDYLQLMVGQGRIESRQQEIAEISRGLKVLARDLDVPVLAIAQLSRAVEARHDKRPMLSDLRDCVAGDTLVMLADGRRVPVRELVGQTPRVLSMSPGGRIVEAESEKVWRVGKRPVFTVRLASGREIRATAKHRLFGEDGWMRVGSLREGDRIATARSLPEPEGAVEWPDARVALLGHLIRDGSYLKGQPLRYTTSCEENSRIVTEAAEAEFGVRANRHLGRGNWHQLVLSGNGNRWHPAGVNLWLRELGVFDQRSFEKRIQDAAFGLGNRQIAVLLRHLWATDGTIFARKPGMRGSSTICFSTNSRSLAEDVSALLLRLGIVARIREVPQGAHRPMFNAIVSGMGNQKRFLDVVGTFGVRQTAAARRVSKSLEGKLAVTNVDTLPVEFFGKVKESMVAHGVSHRAMSAARGTSYNGSARFRFAPSRTLMTECADLLDDDSLRSLATSDLFWDKVVEVVPSGEEEVFDLTVPGPASWLADGIVSHNSGAIEQDADMVMFLYRDEYYNPDSDDKGIAEVIVGKHRNGPTGKTQLAWLEQYTKFASLARRD